MYSTGGLGLNAAGPGLWRIPAPQTSRQEGQKKPSAFSL
jgi:hypothetical protein